jgi:hypothetical protein
MKSRSGAAHGRKKQKAPANTGFSGTTISGFWRRLVTIFDALFGCWHKRISFPLTSKQGQRRSDAATQTGTYIVCLDCGKEFPYDWKSMRVLSPREKQAYAGSQVEVEAKAS